MADGTRFLVDIWGFACEPAMLAMAMSAIFLAFGLDWKKAKWL
jgi:hypothetical protein